jgi:glycosyltransferase involved in cell wall biosynthesis
MKIVSTSYIKTAAYSNPHEWLERINFYIGILEELGKEHQVFAFERISYEGEFVQNGVHYFFVRSQKKVTRFPFRMHRMIKELRPDVVFVNGFIFPLQIIQLRLQLGRNVRIIILHRAERPFGGIKKWLQKLADHAVNAYLFTSLEFKKEWASNISSHKIFEVIQASSVFHVTDKAKARQFLDMQPGPVFLWVGSLITRKDPLTIVKGFLDLLLSGAEAKLYMIYQSDELQDEIKMLLENTGLYKNAVVLVGKIPHADLLHWYNAADFFITGSRYEGSGVALSEAMSCGCIPVTTDFISFKKMTDGKCGFMFEAGNETALTLVLKQALHTTIEKERQKTLDQFRQELSFEAIAKKINHVILQSE